MSTHKPVRQSNIELLRIFAMLMVVALHATFETFGYARASAVQAHPGSWLGIITTASACLGSVDLFVLITGWFGTTFRPKGALKLVLQVAYISIIMTLFAWLMDFKLPTKVMDYFRPLWSYWFVCSYLVLYLLTPVFNAFVEKSDERSLRHYLITFYVCVIPASFVFTDLHNGFAAVPFMGLYLLGRYLRLYLAPRLEQVKPWKLLSTWIACIAFMTLLVWGASMIDQSYTTAIIPLYVSYTNPLLIIASASLLLFFSRMHLQSKAVNWLAAGSFAVYLTHQHPFVRQEYFKLVRQLDQQTTTSFQFFAEMVLFISAIYLSSALIDWVRRIAFKWIRL